VYFEPSPEEWIELYSILNLPPRSEASCIAPREISSPWFTSSPLSQDWFIAAAARDNTRDMKTDQGQHQRYDIHKGQHQIYEKNRGNTRDMNRTTELQEIKTDRGNTREMNRPGQYQR
jgi:hypothetical protein